MRTAEWKFIAFAMAGLAGASPLAAQRAQPPKALADVIACRSIAADAERLACFDAALTALEDARMRGQVAVVDSQDVREARRSLFGLTVPPTRLLDGEERIDTFTGTIRDVRQARGGRWVVQIDNAVWQTTESGYFQVLPRVGQQATVTRGPLGSFRLSVEGRAGLKATRVR